MDPKPITASLTVWVNVLTIAAGLLASPDLHQIVPPEAMPYVLVINSTVNILLRVFKTTRPVALALR